MQLGTQQIIGRKVRSVRELTNDERQDHPASYITSDDPRWKIGVVDPNAPPDLIDLDSNLSKYLRETPLTIQEVDETLRKMLDKKLQEQDGVRPPPH